MEPFDIDKVIQRKLQGNNDLHKQEMDSAQPYVWSAIQNEIGGKRTLTWYHLAAAIALLLICFSSLLYSVQNGHEKEIDLLSDKIDQLQKDYVNQVELLLSKDADVESLGNKLKIVGRQLADLKQHKPFSQKEIIVHRTDTVYSKQFEYITTNSDPVETGEIIVDTKEEIPDQKEITEATIIEIDDAIFPSYSNQHKRQQSETIKLKFGSFTTRSN